MFKINQLRKCFCEALALSPDIDVDGMTYQSNPSWDSVGHMRLVASVETTFNVMFTTDQILDMSSFQKAIDILKQHGVCLAA